MISWPPRTRHTAARSSRTSAFVLHQKNNDKHECLAPSRKKKGQSKIYTMNRLTLQVIYQTKPYPPSRSVLQGRKSSSLYPLFENFQIMSWRHLFNIQTRSPLGPKDIFVLDDVSFYVLEICGYLIVTGTNCAINTTLRPVFCSFVVHAAPKYTDTRTTV